MIRKLYLVLTILLLVLLPMSILKISAKEDFSKFKINILASDVVGTLTIKKINLKENLYAIDSPKNNVEEHITILKESAFPNILILAAHSGTGKIAYFNDLDKLQVNDSINLTYKNKSYSYYIKDIWEEKKDGYININKEESKQLILTTCSPNKKNYQLVINCIEKESN